MMSCSSVEGLADSGAGGGEHGLEVEARLRQRSFVGEERTGRGRVDEEDDVVVLIAVDQLAVRALSLFRERDRALRDLLEGANLNGERRRLRIEVWVEALGAIV